MLITLDGFSGSGKSTLAKKLEREIPGIRVIKADDFFYQRGEKRDKRAGNFNVRRFIKEVTPQIKRGSGFFIRAYDCRSGKFFKKWIPEGNITILEGSYTSTPSLDSYRDLGFFVNCDRREREIRVKSREGDNYFNFLNRWFKDEYNFEIKFRTYKNSIIVNNYNELRDYICGEKLLKIKNLQVR